MSPWLLRNRREQAKHKQGEQQGPYPVFGLRELAYGMASVMSLVLSIRRTSF